MKDINNKQKTVIHRKFQGTVVQAGADKTINVLVKTVKMHPKYRKQYVSTKKYAVHDEKNQAKIGDTVIFQECRPLSKTKRWTLVKIINK